MEKEAMPQGVSRWYVVQVRTGSEESIQTQCIKNIQEAVLERCFIPRYEEKRRVQGRWLLQRKILFPGYVFMVTPNGALLHEQLKTIIGLTKILGTGDTMVALKNEEVAFLEHFGGRGQVVAMSEGIIAGTQVIITDGPLKGYEGYIKKIDRHKRKAWLELPMFGRLQRVQVGVEIVRKVEG